MAETKTKRTYTKKEKTEEPAKTEETVKETAKKEKAQPQEPTFTLDDVKRMIAEALAAKEAEPQETKPAEPQAVVTVLFVAEVAPNNVLEIPGYGMLTPNSYLEVPKKEFGGKFMSNLVRKLIAKRHLLVVDGLTEDERKRWNCLYKEGEVLDEKAFDHMLDYDLPTLETVFSGLCEEHQWFVARRFITAKERNDNRVALEKVRRINEISKKYVQEGMLAPLKEIFSADIM